MKKPTSKRTSTKIERSERIRGSALRWSWTEGPVKGSSHEHVFNDDGSLVWSCIGGPGKGHSAREKSYAALRVSEDVELVSYLSSTGWTLTVALNFSDHTMAGFASNGKTWSPCRGTFEVARESHQDAGMTPMTAESG